jgi:capsular polysaccharide export protein
METSIIMPGLHFVFLQGMPSAFFSRIANELSRRGCKATGINFCLGDWIFWRGPDTVNYRGSLADWPAFIERFFERNKVTDVVMLGDQRTFHKPAIEIARRRGIRVSVLDFGYLRPDWLTLEQDGKSANSRFPKTPEELLKLASGVAKADLAGRYTDSFWKMARRDLLYSFSNVLFGWIFFPRYRRSDQRPHPLIYFPAIGRRLFFAWAGRRRALDRMHALFETNARYFVFPLQLEHDFQIIAYSPFASQKEAIRMVIKSFAAHADASTRLVVKVHPWDPGLTKWGRHILRWAREFGVGDRVDYFDGGDLDGMTRRSAGMITVNSTAGIRALQLGTPVMTLGEAVYNIPGLTYRGALDSYWTDAAPPDPALVDALVNAIAATIQIRGVFFAEPGMSTAVGEAVERLYSGTVGMPVAAKAA